jgi:DNA-binding transcriptional LysR family regulator
MTMHGSGPQDVTSPEQSHEGYSRSARNPTEHLAGIGIFVRLAESLSFTAAAHRLGMSPSGVSKAIKRLELHLGVRLVNRTTRSMSLSAEGEVYLGHCLGLLADLDNAGAALMHATTAPGGHVRIQAPRALARLVILQPLAALLEQYPDLSVDVCSTVATARCRKKASTSSCGMVPRRTDGSLPGASVG